MTLPSILALAGCAALLIGLLGGGLKAKEVEVHKSQFGQELFPQAWA